MPTTKCPECGAAIKDDSKFCNYCGAKLPDDTKRVEVKIDKRIEDVAEIKRAKYEEKESELRQKKELRELKTKSFRRKFELVVLGICIIFALIAILIEPNGFFGIMGAISIYLGIFLIAFIFYQILTGKW